MEFRTCRPITPRSFAEPGDDQPFYVNDQAPKNFSDLERYTTLNGLNMIMR